MTTQTTNLASFSQWAERQARGAAEMRQMEDHARLIAEREDNFTGVAWHDFAEHDRPRQPKLLGVHYNDAARRYTYVLYFPDAFSTKVSREQALWMLCTEEA